MKYFLILLVISIPFISEGQPVITSSSFPSIGDTLYTHIDYLPSNIHLQAAEPGDRWDFSTLQSPFARQMEILPANFFAEHKYFPKANAAVMLKENQLGFYQIGKRTISLLGFVGDDPLELGLNQVTYFNPPLIERRAPLKYQDGYQTESIVTYSFALEDLTKNVFSELPFTPDSIRISLTYDRQDYADGWGTLLIPGGIYDVLRERRQEARTIQVEARVGKFPWQNVTDLLTTSDKIGNQYGITYYYHSNEEIDPIAIAYMDGEEKKLLNIIYKARNTTPNIQEIGNAKPGIYAYPNPAIVNARFEFTNLPPGNYKLAIFNILGLEEWSKTYFIDGHRTEKINIASLRKGSYLYSLIDERGKTISTKRLIVIKP